MPFRPNEITREHVLAGVAKIEAEHIQLIPSTKYDAYVNDKPYPPKEVMRYAHEQLDGEMRWEYSGGPQTFRYLENLGFRVERKPDSSDPISAMIERYKAHIAETMLIDELYKWKLLHRFKGRPDINNPDVHSEIQSIDFSNLIFHNARVVMLSIADQRPNDYWLAIKDLFDENISLLERVKKFRLEIDTIYRDMDETLGTHHDERTISTMLTYRDPEKYTFYKDSFYRKYCTLLKVNPKKSGEKYVHYLELIDDLINEYIVDDSELLTSIGALLSAGCFEDSNHKMLEQDILYQMLDNSATTSY